MSSHYFVKEGQEPALFILDAYSFHLAEPLLEWIPLVLTTEEALDKVLSWGIKIDVVLCKEERVRAIRGKLFIQSPVKILPYKKYDILTTGLQFLISKNQRDVNVLVESFEEMFITIQNCVDQIEIIFFDRQFKWSAVLGVFEKWLPFDTELRIRESISQQEMDYEGLKEHGSILKASHDGIVRIESDLLFWVGERI